MADIEQFLTKKVGPLPMWGWAAGVGGLASVLFLYKKGGSPTSAAQVAAQTPSYSPSPIVITTPANMPASTSSVNPNPIPPTSAPPPQPVWQFGFGMPRDKHQWVWHLTAEGYKVYPQFPQGQVYPASTSDPSAMIPSGPAYTWQWAAVPNAMDPSGNPWTDQSYAQALNAAGMGGGMGGGSVVRMLTGGGKVGRFSSPHAHHQFVNVQGMGGGGLHAISKRTGIPLVRLQALNHKYWRSGGKSHNVVVVA